MLDPSLADSHPVAPSYCPPLSPLVAGLPGVAGSLGLPGCRGVAGCLPARGLPGAAGCCRVPGLPGLLPYAAGSAQLPGAAGCCRVLSCQAETMWGHFQVLPGAAGLLPGYCRVLPGCRVAGRLPGRAFGAPAGAVFRASGG